MFRNPEEIKPPQQIDKYVKKESYLLVLDSRNANTYNNDSKMSDVTFDLKYPIRTPNDCIYMTWVVQTFTCPVSWYLIDSTNDKLKYTVNSISTVTFPHGNYNVKSFMSKFISLMPAGFTINLDPLTNKFSIGYSQSFNLENDSTIMKILGGLDNVDYYSGFGNILTMPYPCNFGGLNNINIKCNTIKTDNLDSHDSCSVSSIIASIPVNASSNGVIYYEKRNDFEFEVKETTISTLNISIEDDQSNYIDFNNQNWNLTIQINYIREIEKDIYTGFHDILNNYGYNNI